MSSRSATRPQPQTSPRARGPLVCFLVVLVGCGALLWRLSNIALPHDLDSSPESMTIASLWCVASVGWIWLALGTVLSLAHRTIPALRDVAQLDLLTLRWVRSAVERAAIAGVAASLVMPSVATRAAAATWPTSSAAIATSNSAGTTTTVDAPFVRGTRDAPDAPAQHPPRQTAQPAHIPLPPHQPTYTVQHGDNFWSIARSEVLRRNPAANRSDVATYWSAILQLNRARMRSGNPNLIFVGEVIELAP